MSLRLAAQAMMLQKSMRASAQERKGIHLASISFALTKPGFSQNSKLLRMQSSASPIAQFEHN